MALTVKCKTIKFPESNTLENLCSIGFDDDFLDKMLKLLATKENISS